jgi:hypothetical protein
MSAVLMAFIASSGKEDWTEGMCVSESTMIFMGTSNKKRREKLPANSLNCYYDKILSIFVKEKKKTLILFLIALFGYFGIDKRSCFVCELPRGQEL